MNWTHASVMMGLVAVSIVGCGKGDDPVVESQDSVGDAAARGDAVASQGEELFEYGWTIDPGEIYYCKTQTLTEDLWISALSPVADENMHHVVLSFQDPAGPDGVASSADPGSNCNGLPVGNMVYAGFVGTDEFVMPEGVALKIPAGKQLILNLHLYNTSSDPVSGSAGVRVVKADPSLAKEEAEVVFMGSIFGLSVPPGKSTTTATCTMSNDETIFAALPHMHRTGTYMKSTAIHADGTVATLIDQPYLFNEQKYFTLPNPVALKAGERVQTECTYENPGANTLAFGESTDAEMCLSSVYRYPARAVANDGLAPLACDDGHSR